MVNPSHIIRLKIFPNTLYMKHLKRHMDSNISHLRLILIKKLATAMDKKRKIAPHLRKGPEN